MSCHGKSGVWLLCCVDTHLSVEQQTGMLTISGVNTFVLTI